jgi:hypothetical protein
MKASFPGEYIHMIIIELSTLKDGKVIMFISVDNYSRYCFSNAVTNPLNFEKVTSHIDSIIESIHERQPEVTPTFIMGYGEQLQFKLARHYRKNATFKFDVAQANELASPVANDLLKTLGKPFNN